MSTTTAGTKTLTMSDTAVLLRAQLGALRTWYPFLADNIRGKQDICGIRLLPCGKQKMARDRGWRPVYAITDIKTFVEKVLAAVPSAGKSPIKVSVLAIDRARSWRVNRFDESGAPVAVPPTPAVHHASI